MIFLFVAFATLFGRAEGKGTEITVRLGSAPGRQVLLAHYYGTNIYPDDTVLTDSQGMAVFTSDTLLHQGLYKIYLDGTNHFDFLLGEDQVLQIVNPSFHPDELEIKGARESVEFDRYLKWLRQQQRKLSQLDSALTSASEDEKKIIEGNKRVLTREVSDYWNRTSREYPGTLLASFLMANYFEELKEEDIPEDFLANDSLKWTYQYNYRKNHFFDHLDFSDERLLYTPLVKSRLDTYLEKVLLQMYDSVKPAVFAILEKTEPYPGVFRFVTSHLLNSSLASRVMGMDALFVDIARKYYLSGRAAWADSTSLARIRENVIFLENNLIGHKARDVRMETLDGRPFSLYQQKNRFTVLVFYEPNCGHCNTFVPRLYQEVYLPFRDKGLEVVACYTMDKREEWEKFVEEKEIKEWINVWDEHHLSRFKIIYDTRTTPAVYLLDSDKTIIAKKFTVEFLKEYLGYFLGSETPGN